MASGKLLRLLVRLRRIRRGFKSPEFLWSEVDPMQLPPPFAFQSPGVLVEGDLSLILRETVVPMAGRAPAYRFEMRRIPDGAKVGRIELRIGCSKDLVLYTGNIGYRVEPLFRGRRYAARGCLLLRELAQRHGHTELWITCDPDNLPSRRSCELTGASFEGIVPVPPHHFFYKAGSKEKCRFRLAVEDQSDHSA